MRAHTGRSGRDPTRQGADGLVSLADHARQRAPGRMFKGLRRLRNRKIDPDTTGKLSLQKAIDDESNRNYKKP